MWQERTASPNPMRIADYPFDAALGLGFIHSSSRPLTLRILEPEVHFSMM
jgi:hypothetical protein